ncbi:MAG: MerC domain-containing protein [Chitinophagaceae bacterium]|nr:MerC domain-containing protein [Chitinophagaceae bacterium]
MKYKLNWDVMGVATSIACAIHCAFLPVLMASLPVFGIDIINNIYFEWGMIALAFIVGAYSLYHGYTKHHHSFLPFILFLTGMLFLVLKQIYHNNQYWFLAIAVVCILTAHYKNYMLCHKSQCSSPHHKH